jgi:hypothetical protein
VGRGWGDDLLDSAYACAAMLDVFRQGRNDERCERIQERIDQIVALAAPPRKKARGSR